MNEPTVSVDGGDNAVGRMHAEITTLRCQLKAMTAERDAALYDLSIALEERDGARTFEAPWERMVKRLARIHTLAVDAYDDAEDARHIEPMPTLARIIEESKS